MRCNSGLFNDCTALLVAAREKLLPRAPSAEGVSKGGGLTRSIFHQTKRRYSANLFAEAGSNRPVQERQLLAQSIEGYIHALQFPTDSRQEYKALGIPLTPRVMSALALGTVSAMATAMFRLVTG